MQWTILKSQVLLYKSGQPNRVDTMDVQLTLSQNRPGLTFLLPMTGNCISFHGLSSYYWKMLTVAVSRFLSCNYLAVGRFFYATFKTKYIMEIIWANTGQFLTTRSKDHVSLKQFYSLSGF